MMPMFIFMPSFEGLGDEYGCQVGEDKCLYEGDQYFDQVNEDRKQDEERRSAPAQSNIHRAEDKDQDDEAEDNDMAGDHIGEKPDDQGERFGEYTHELHGPHDDFNGRGNG